MTSVASSADGLSGPVGVCVDRPLLSLDRPFTYDLPAELGAGVGSLVQVPFHGRATRGWVLGPIEDLPERMLEIKKVVSPVRFFDERRLVYSEQPSFYGPTNFHGFVPAFQDVFLFAAGICVVAFGLSLFRSQEAAESKPAVD